MRRDVFQAIADPTRRAIVLLMAVQAMTPNQLAQHFAITRQAVSKHLRILTECQLVKPQPDGRAIYYALEAAKLDELEQWLDQCRKSWEGRFSQLDDVLTTLKTTGHDSATNL
jgi:DNA-binding transcriptional ArsR family regulator